MYEAERLRADSLTFAKAVVFLSENGNHEELQRHSLVSLVVATYAVAEQLAAIRQEIVAKLEVKA